MAHIEQDYILNWVERIASTNIQIAYQFITRAIDGLQIRDKPIIEARRNGIHPYCITIDKEARAYLSHMYGPAAYTVIDEVRKLPLKVADIYRRLTT